MQSILKRGLKIISFSLFILSSVVVSGFWHKSDESKGYTVSRGGEQLKNALLVGVAHADAPVTSDGGPAAGDGGGDCGGNAAGDGCG